MNAAVSGPGMAIVFAAEARTSLSWPPGACSLIAVPSDHRCCAASVSAMTTERRATDWLTMSGTLAIVTP